MSTPDLPPGLRHRPPTPADVEAVTSLIAACELAADGVPDVSTEDVRGDWNRPGFDLAADAVLVLDGETSVAYAETYLGRSWVHVHPQATGRGIGSALLQWSEARARRQGRRKVGQTVTTANPAARRLFETAGYLPRWEAWILMRPLDTEPPAPLLPEGVEIRTFQPGRDERSLYHLIDTAFNDWPDRDGGMGFEDWSASLLERTDTDPGLAFLAEDGGDLVGGAVCLIYDNEGWVQQLAVKGSHRGRGIGTALLVTAFGEFPRRGLRAAGLSTDSRTGARSMYEHIGMRVERSFTRWSKNLA